ncbi:MAG TPA: TIR domain-containing protein, partial [Sphingomonadaceae bacterium]|nr:TIR domain-containing protein [Sphingomonadaceae bacterium]
MAAPDIFLSYNRDDAARARQFAQGFEAEGFEVWWDANLKSGEEYDRITEQALKSAKAVVVLWSPRSVDSRWVRAEATLAQRNRTLMPAMIEACDRPVMFELHQTAELSHWQGDRADPAWQAFVADLRSMQGMEAPAPETPVPPPVAGAVSPPPRSRDRRIVFGAIAAALIAVLAVGYAAFGGGGLVSQSEERIPVLVRAFAASGSGDPNEVALANGISDELINRLRRIPELQIATARSDGSPPSSAFESAHIVEGSIRSSGDQLRVTARLFKSNGEVLWSETFDRQLADLFEVQEQIAKSIGDALSVSLDVGANATAYGGTDNPEAYAAFVQGQIHGLDFDQSVPVRYYEQAIALDPNFVRAYANLASTYGNRIPVASSKEEMDRLLEEMDAVSARALDANPNVALSNTARAWYFVTIKDLPQAETLMQRASELDRGIDFSLRGALAQYAVTMGRNRKALSISESTALIDPIFEDTPAKIFMLMMNGRYRESTTLFDKLTTDPQVSLQPFIFHSFWARVLAGNEAAAIDWLKAMNIPNLTLAA